MTNIPLYLANITKPREETLTKKFREKRKIEIK